MAKRKTFQTDILIGGEVSPTLAKAQATACNYLKNISNFSGFVKASAVGTVAGIMFNRAKDAAINFGKGTLEAASNLQETQGKINEVFKNSSGILNQWSKTSTRTMGLSQQSALDAAALYGDMATGMNISRQRAAQMAMTLTQLGADLSSFKNISNDMAQTALKSVFTGETESLKNLGVVMTQANLEEFARTRGIKKKISKMKEAEKVELRYQYVLAKTKNAQGDYSRTALNAANAQRTFQQSTADLQAKIGENFLPYYAKGLNKANKWLIANSDTIVNYSVKAAQAAVKAAPYAIKAVQLTVKAVQVAAPYVIKTIQLAIKAAQAAAPYVANVITLLGNAYQGAVRVTNTIRNAIQTVQNGFAAIRTGINNFIGTISNVINQLKEVFAMVNRCTQAVNNFLNMRGNVKINLQQTQLSPQRYTEMRAAKHALGTHNFVGGSTWVGENGPELINLPRGTEIMSRNKSVAAAQATNFTMPITINIGGNANAEIISNAAKEVMPNIKAQIDAYFRQKQRLGYSF